MAHNNLGVAYRELGAASLAVRSYMTSAGQGNTLAMANMAQLKAGVGFIDEARKLLEEASTGEDVHKNVYTGLERLESQQKNDQKLRETALQRAAVVQPKLRELGESLIRILPDSAATLSGSWVDESDHEYRLRVGEDGHVECEFVNAVKRSNYLSGERMLSFARLSWDRDEKKMFGDGTERKHHGNALLGFSNTDGIRLALLTSEQAEIVSLRRNGNRGEAE